MSDDDLDELHAPEPCADEGEPGGYWPPVPSPDVGTRRGGLVLASTGHWVEV
jgi:hypothetical protein